MSISTSLVETIMKLKKKFATSFRLVCFAVFTHACYPCVHSLEFTYYYCLALRCLVLDKVFFLHSVVLFVVIVNVPLKSVQREKTGLKKFGLKVFRLLVSYIRYIGAYSRKKTSIKPRKELILWRIHCKNKIYAKKFTFNWHAVYVGICDRNFSLIFNLIYFGFYAAITVTECYRPFIGA